MGSDSTSLHGISPHILLGDLNNKENIVRGFISSRVRYIFKTKEDPENGALIT